MAEPALPTDIETLQRLVAAQGAELARTISDTSGLSTTAR
jgi:hypothetical protein